MNPAQITGAVNFSLIIEVSSVAVFKQLEKNERACTVLSEVASRRLFKQLLSRELIPEKPSGMKIVLTLIPLALA